MANYFRTQIEGLGLRIGPEPDLAITYFWHEPINGGNSDEFTREIMKFMLEDGSIFVTSAIIKNQFVIRMSFLSFRSHKEHVDQCVQIVKSSFKRAIDKLGE